MNYIRGVISEPDLLYSAKEELENLKDQTITDVHRITMRQNEQVFLTKAPILIFNSPTLHARVKAAYISLCCSILYP